MRNHLCQTAYCNTLVFSLFFILVLFGNNAAFGQNPQMISTEISAMISMPGYGLVEVEVLSTACPLYQADTPLTNGESWDSSKTTSKGRQLTYAATQGSNFPFLTTVTYNGIKLLTHITTEDVDKYWDKDFGTGYKRISSASMEMNCHGYSTGLGYWMDSFDRLMEDDYQSFTQAKDFDLNGNAIKGNSGHSIRLYEAKMEEVSGEQLFWIVKTREKNRESGVYEKVVSDVYDPTDDVGFKFYKKK